MRVLVAHNRYRLPGGEERHVELLEQGLNAAGVDVCRFERDSAELLGSPLKQFGTGLTMAYRPGGGGIARAIKEWSPSVVHFHNIWPQLTPSAMRIAKQSGAVVVLTAHNFRFACPGGTLLRSGAVHDDCIEGSSLACALRDPRGALSESLAYGVALEVHRRFRFLARWVDAFVAPSAFMAEMLARAGLPESRVHICPSGVPIGAISTASSGTSALYAGRLSEEKGVRTFLEAARLAPDVALAGAGSGPLESLVQAGPVTYLGRLEPSRLREALGAASYTIVPSECYENFPFAALESFAAGKPVIASRIGGLPEIVEDGVTGLLIPPRSPRALADAMSHFSARPDLTREMGMNALRRARSRFSLERQVDDLIALYGSLLGANRP
jgi:glycosyltransferase involved in cell wall biosynthesis